MFLKSVKYINIQSNIIYSYSHSYVQESKYITCKLHREVFERCDIRGTVHDHIIFPLYIMQLPSPLTKRFAITNMSVIINNVTILVSWKYLGHPTLQNLHSVSHYEERIMSMLSNMKPVWKNYVEHMCLSLNYQPYTTKRCTWVWASWSERDSDETRR